MRKEGRGEERDTTTHLIKIQIFTHASRVTKFSPYELCMYRQLDPRASGTCTILLLAAVFKSYLDRQLKQSGKRLTTFKCSNTQLQNGRPWWCIAQLTLTRPPGCRSRTVRQMASVFPGVDKRSLMFTKISNTTSVGKKKMNLIKCVVVSRSSPLPTFFMTRSWLYIVWHNLWRMRINFILFEHVT